MCILYKESVIYLMDTLKTMTKDMLNGIPKESLRDMYWLMLLSRRTDERAWMIHRQGKIAFHISAIGHEAIQAAMAKTINLGVDYIVPYYRDLTLMLGAGVTPEDFMRSLFGKAGEISSAARQMPSHFGAKEFNIISTSAVVATQLTHAAGLAFGIQYRQKLGLQDPNDTTKPRLAITSVGEGSTSQGDFHESLNWAGIHKLPLIVVVQNNQYAISEPVEKQMAVEHVADRAAGYGIEGVVVDGMDVFATYEAMKIAVERAYSGAGATLLEAKTYRMTPHSSDDDDRTYRTREEVDEWKARDPLTQFRTQLLDAKVLDQAAIDEMDERAKDIINAAQKATEEAPFPAPEEALAPVYKED